MLMPNYLNFPILLDSKVVMYFDAYTQIGPRDHKHPAHGWKLEDVIREMEHCSISGALVQSNNSINYDPMFGNRELSAQLKPHDFLFPIWNLMPHQTGECPAPTELDRILRDYDVRAFSIHPAHNAWDWEADHAEELLAWLQARSMLCVVKKGQLGDWRATDRFLKQYPNLPVLLIHASWSDQRYLLPLIRHHRNLHITCDSFQVHYGLEHLYKAGCRDQVLFGSNAPLMSMGAHRAFIDYADIPAAAKAKIAGGNLTRLLQGQHPPNEIVNLDEDALMNAARQGKPLPIPVVDMHMHILHDGENGGGGSSRMERGGPEGVFPQLQRLGVTGGGFMSWLGTVSMDTLAGNRCVERALDAAPPGFWGLASLDPSHHPGAEFERLVPLIHSDPRFIGMKPYTRFSYAYDHKVWSPWWQLGNERQYYALLHRTRSDFSEVDALAKKYPRIRWVVVHCGSDYFTADQAIACMAAHSNVYAEITLTPVTLGIIDYLVTNAGENRILYGSDLPMRDPRQQLGWVVFSRLSLQAKRKVLRENALRVIAPCADQLPARNRP